MIITDNLFESYLECETKAYLKSEGILGSHQQYREWEEEQRKLIFNKCLEMLKVNNNIVTPYEKIEFSQNNVRSVQFNCTFQHKQYRTKIHALEASSSKYGKGTEIIPIRFVNRNKIGKKDRLLAAFDSFVFSEETGKAPPFARIIHGDEPKYRKVMVHGLLDDVSKMVKDLSKILLKDQPPDLYLCGQCSQCEYRSDCNNVAIKSDALTLLSNMTPTEIKRHHKKGIFTVNQLSYTFRPRRKHKRKINTPKKHSNSLKARAIRKKQIHVIGKPKVELTANSVYFDVEGIPDKKLYYLIGLRWIKNNDSLVQKSFWANDQADEKNMYSAFLETLAKIKDPVLIHYGNYDSLFLKNMQNRYPDLMKNFPSIKRLFENTINLLSIIYSSIYFPTYSNSLKQIANFLGFEWTDKNTFGFDTVILRTHWELTKNNDSKQKIITYNSEDCEALEIVTNAVIQISSGNYKQHNMINTTDLKKKDSYGFGPNNFHSPDLSYINDAAYWNYQRDKVYIKTEKHLKRRKSQEKRRTIKHRPNKTIVLEGRPPCCPNCKTIPIYRNGKVDRLVYDLKISHSGIKRWIIRYKYDRFFCRKCNKAASLENQPSQNQFGKSLNIYVLYQMLELRLSYRSISDNLWHLFKLNISHGRMAKIKRDAAETYYSTYKGLLNKILKGELVHVDETKINLIGKEGYVWVVTNLENTVYFYTNTREGKTIQKILKGFDGVLVSDFYSAYDSINCPQQKCLIHLIRDLNNDLYKHPFNEELINLLKFRRKISK